MKKGAAMNHIIITRAVSVLAYCDPPPQDTEGLFCDFARHAVTAQRVLVHVSSCHEIKSFHCYYSTTVDILLQIQIQMPQMDQE